MDYRTILVGLAVATSVPLFEALARFDPERVTDWKAWAVGVGAASVRQVGVFAIAQLIDRGLLPHPRP